MPLHDWTPVPAGLFHHFHQHWSVEITRTLNRDGLPNGLSALIERRSGPKQSEVPAIEVGKGTFLRGGGSQGGVATMERPATRIVRRTTRESYSDRANRIVVKHHLGRIIAVIEIVSPGNKDSRAAMRDFVERTIDFLRSGIHVLVVDVFPPSPRDPCGLHKVIWDEFLDEPFEFPSGKDRILASYETGGVRAAYVEPVGIGDALAEMPLFIANDLHVKVPLEPTYQAAWEASPEALRTAVETGVVPEPDAE